FLSVDLGLQSSDCAGSSAGWHLPSFGLTRSGKALMTGLMVLLPLAAPGVADSEGSAAFDVGSTGVECIEISFPTHETPPSQQGLPP
ncbi:hypothetical protein, partial [Mycolicibacter sinensis]